MAYGTRGDEGLKTFREIEYKALREHDRNRAVAKDRKALTTTGQTTLFASEFHDDRTIEQEIAGQQAAAKSFVLERLANCGDRMRFSQLITLVLEPFMLRTTNVKDVCVELANTGKIENTWKALGLNKPRDNVWIMLKDG